MNSSNWEWQCWYKLHVGQKMKRQNTQGCINPGSSYGKRRLITFNDAGIGRENCRRRRESGQPRERLFQEHVKSIILLKWFRHLSQEQETSQMCHPKTHLLPLPSRILGYQYLVVRWTTVLCCLDATLALSSWWQSSQLEQWSFSLTRLAEPVDIPDHNWFFSFCLLCVVCHQPEVLF